MKQNASDPNKIGRNKFGGGVYDGCHEILLLGNIRVGSLKIISQLVAIQGVIFVAQDCSIIAPDFLEIQALCKLKGTVL